MMTSGYVPLSSSSSLVLCLPTMFIVVLSSSFASAWMGSSLMTTGITNQVRRHSINPSLFPFTTIGTPCQNFRFKRRTITSLHDVWNDANGADYSFNKYETETYSNDDVDDYFPTATKLEMVLELHRPLGCTVDESLAHEDNGARHVFVSKVTPGGFAEAAGLQVGDVIVGLTGLFGDKSNVGGLGLDLVKGLVSSCPEEDPLWILVARGTNVMERHETALVDLCTSPGSDQKEMEQCVIDFIASGYNLEGNDEMGAVEEATMSACSDTDTECLLDDLWNDWGEDNAVGTSLPPLPSTEAEQATASPAKPKPWSSRSSPSGTYVRDPRTGKVRNIDA